MDIQTLRSEIKAWERAYAEKHGRKPTPKEVKADPIGEYERALGRYSSTSNNN